MFSTQKDPTPIEIIQYLEDTYGNVKNKRPSGAIAGPNRSLLLGREKQMEQFFSWLYERWKNGIKPPDSEPRMYNSHICTQSGPGGGKTHFVSCLATFSSEITKNLPRGKFSF
jgi:hypothetical protein